MNFKPSCLGLAWHKDVWVKCCLFYILYYIINIFTVVFRRSVQCHQHTLTLPRIICAKTPLLCVVRYQGFTLKICSLKPRKGLAVNSPRILITFSLEISGPLTLLNLIFVFIEYFITLIASQFLEKSKYYFQWDEFPFSAVK